MYVEDMCAHDGGDRVVAHCDVGSLSSDVQGTVGMGTVCGVRETCTVI